MKKTIIARYIALAIGTAITAFAGNAKAQFSSTNFSYIGSITTFVIPISGEYQFIASGGSGGNVTGASGGYSATITADFMLTAGQILDVAVGGEGANGSSTVGGGGGGGTFLVTSTGTPLLIVGGGGGGGTSGQPGNSDDTNNDGLGSGGGSDTANGNTAGSGAGFQGDGQQQTTSANGKDWTNGLAGGGSGTGKGGFGGGGAGGAGSGKPIGGGAGGATGGKSGHHYVINGGFGNGGSPGGNYSAQPILSATVNSADGNGYFDLTLESVPEPSAYALFGIGLLTLVIALRQRRI